MAAYFGDRKSGLDKAGRSIRAFGQRVRDMREPDIPSSNAGVIMDVDLVIANSVRPDLVADFCRKIEKRRLDGVGFGAVVR